ncbi:MAG: adenosylmethionine decarboxylase, partial [Thermodesulfobacteriota bacterium]|nr:adenosylmethionine decarboxylase [Thermodesulfobacteriota bacterium]
MNSLGRHLVVELMDCDSEILKDMGTIKDFMIRAATTAGATPVQNVFHSFNPMGISGVVVIAESHLTIHTWPEYGY